MNAGYIKIALSILLYAVIILLIFGNTLFSFGQDKNTPYYAPLVFAFLLSSWGVYDLFKDNPGYLKIGFAISLVVFAELITAAIQEDLASDDVIPAGDKPFDPIPYYVAIQSTLLASWGIYNIVKK